MFIDVLYFAAIRGKRPPCMVSRAEARLGVPGFDPSVPDAGAERRRGPPGEFWGRESGIPPRYLLYLGGEAYTD